LVKEQDRLKILWNLTDKTPSTGTVVTVGTFDGIHVGHRMIIDTVVQQARENNLRSLLMTFEPHPKLVVSSNGTGEIKLLTTIEEKIQVLEQSGLDYLVVANFTRTFAATSAEQFVRHFLIDKCRMKAIVIGRDHVFGRGKEGTFHLLQQLGEELDFRVFSVEPVDVAGQLVSSTQIRRLLMEARVEQAALLLGRPYALQGRVVKGEGQGRLLGFPTANLRPPSNYKLLPREGIYATQVKIDDQMLNSATYVGNRPTFNGTEKVAEVHLPDFNGDLYDRDIEVFFHSFLRDDKKFINTTELKKQIDSDIRRAVQILDHGGIS
jgi:riboflavin kinase / FMN adenylyltransferase